MAPRIGFIGIIGELFDKDPQGTLEWVAGLGFDGMEGAAVLADKLGVTVAQARERLEAAGLVAAVQGRIDRNATDEQNIGVLARAKEIGARYVVDYYDHFEDRDAILRYAEFANRMGRLADSQGLVFLYHNHDHEMKPHNGERGIEIFLANTDPKLVQVELDVAWVTFGGADPVAMLRQYPDRFPVLHMKDFAHLHPGSPTAEGVRQEAIFAEVGTGVVNTAGVVEAAKQLGIDWLVIEQDRMNTLGPRESLESSYRNLRALVG